MLAKTKRVRAKDRYHLVVFLESADNPEDLSRVEEVVVLTKATLRKINCLIKAHEHRSRFDGLHALKRTVKGCLKSS